jgi:hypothetical protein
MPLWRRPAVPSTARICFAPGGIVPQLGRRAGERTCLILPSKRTSLVGDPLSMGCIGASANAALRLVETDMGTNDLVVGEERAICQEAEGRRSSRNHALALHHSVLCLSGYLQSTRTPPRPAGFLVLAACSCRPARTFRASVAVPSNREYMRSIGMSPFVLERTQGKLAAPLPSGVINGTRFIGTTTVSDHKRHTTETPPRPAGSLAFGGALLAEDAPATGKWCASDRPNARQDRRGLIVYILRMKWKGNTSHLMGKRSSESHYQKADNFWGSGDVRHLGEESCCL